MIMQIVTLVLVVVAVLGGGFLTWLYFEGVSEYKQQAATLQRAGKEVPPMKGPYKLWHVAAGFVAIITLAVCLNCFYTVDAGQRGIVLSFGSVSKVVEPGLNFRTPIRDRIVLVDVKTQKAHAPANAGTKDLQNVDTQVALNYHVNADKLEEIYSKTGLDVETKIIDPRIQEVVKAVIAKYSAEQLLSMREAVKNEIAASLRRSIAEYYIVVEDIQITNFQFSASFNAAIEAKQTAEQQAMKAENDLKRIEVEAKQTIATAQAEAEKIRIQAEAIQKQGGKEYVQLKAIEKWNGALPTYMGGDAPIPFVSVNK